VQTWLTDNVPSTRYPVYTRANAGEVLPSPLSPLSWTMAWMKGFQLGWRDSQITAGTFEEHEFPEAPMQVVASIFGHFYINGSLSRIFGVRTPGLSAEIIDATYFGGHPDVPPYIPQEGDENPVCSERLAAFLGGIFTTESLPQLVDDQAHAQRVRDGRGDLSSLTDAELVTRARSLLPDLRRMFDQHIIMTASAGTAPQPIVGIAEAIGDPSIVMRLSAGVGDVDSAAPSWAMWELSRAANADAAVTAIFNSSNSDLNARLRAEPAAAAWIAQFDEFLARFGSRGPNEWDLRSDMWETDPNLALALISVMRGAPDDEHPDRRNAAVVADRAAVVEQVTAALTGNDEALGMFLASVRATTLYMAGRERSKTNIIKVFHEMRMALRELASRHGLTMSELCMLLESEVDGFVADPASFTTTLRQREVEYLTLFELDLPFIVDGGKPVPSIDSLPRRGSAHAGTAAAGDVLQGMPGCPGVARGRARVILDCSDPFALEPGDVLIAPLTDPAWTPLFVPAAAVVVDVGAMVSHAVIVSRELGIPCVVSCTHATERIADGAMVEVNGHTGQVTVL
jgi:rifampicin phosphotransferase